MTIRAPFASASPGGGTDVGPFPETEGGAVLSATIDRYTYGSSSARTDDRIRIESIDLARSRDFAVDQSTLDLSSANAEDDDLLTTAEVVASLVLQLRRFDSGATLAPDRAASGLAVASCTAVATSWHGARCEIQEHQSAS